MFTLLSIVVWFLLYSGTNAFGPDDGIRIQAIDDTAVNMPVDIKPTLIQFFGWYRPVPQSNPQRFINRHGKELTSMSTPDSYSLQGPGLIVSITITRGRYSVEPFTITHSGYAVNLQAQYHGVSAGDGVTLNVPDVHSDTQELKSNDNTSKLA
eukprot:213409_1